MSPENGNRRAAGATADSVGRPSDAAENTGIPIPTQARPIFVLTIEYAGTPEFAIHGLRKLLKRLLRDHHFRARSIEQTGGPQP